MRELALSGRVFGNDPGRVRQAAGVANRRRLDGGSPNAWRAYRCRKPRVAQLTRFSGEFGTPQLGSFTWDPEDGCPTAPSRR